MLFTHLKPFMKKKKSKKDFAVGVSLCSVEFDLGYFSAFRFGLVFLLVGRFLIFTSSALKLNFVQYASYLLLISGG